MTWNLNLVMVKEGSSIKYIFIFIRETFLNNLWLYPHSSKKKKKKHETYMCGGNWTEAYKF